VIGSVGRTPKSTAAAKRPAPIAITSPMRTAATFSRAARDDLAEEARTRRAERTKGGNLE